MSEPEEVPTSTSDTSTSGIGKRLLDAHLGSVFAGLTLVFVVLKVLAVSHGDTTTALGITTEAGTSSLVVGTLISALGPILANMVSVLLWRFALAEAPAKAVIRPAVIAVTVAYALASPAIVGLFMIVPVLAVLASRRGTEGIRDTRCHSLDTFCAHRNALSRASV